MRIKSTTKYALLLVAGMTLLALTLAVILSHKSPTAAAQEQPFETIPQEFLDQIPAEIKDQIKERMTKFSGMASLRLAKAFGFTDTMGKLNDTPNPVSSIEDPDDSPPNIDIGGTRTHDENEPTVASNPKNRNNIVAGFHRIGPDTFVPPPRPFRVRCVAANSFNGGASFSPPIPMPHLHPRSTCSDPVVAWAPDGSRVYYTYMDIKNFFIPGPRPEFRFELDIVVSHSDDGGVNWTGPVIALDGAPTIIRFNPFEIIPGFDYDKPWIGTHDDPTQSNWVYVTATRFDNFSPFGIHIAFTRSGAKNASGSWSAPVILDSGGPIPIQPFLRVVQGSRPEGGVGGNVLVAWYHSGNDGWLTGNLQIRTRHSSNNGASFGPIVVAAEDKFEAPFFLGPFGSFFRWWATMFPDVEIAPDGSAHIVYTHDPVANPGFFSTTAEDGDIRYVSSAGPPYLAWSAPVTVNDNGDDDGDDNGQRPPRAQGFPAITINGGTIHAIFYDSRLSPFGGNLLYDVFRARKELRGRWGSNERVTNTSSMSDFVFIGDYFDVTPSGEKGGFGVWTDRRHQLENFIFISEDDVKGTATKN